MTYHVFYHFPCNDGELSRVIWDTFEPNSFFYKWQHNDHENEINIINNLPENSNVVFLDLTPTNDIEKMSYNNKYIIIDHHKNAMLSLVEKKQHLPNYNILLYTQKGFLENADTNNNLSGCKLTWLYFQKNIEYPSVVKYIGDRDVFDFSNQNTEEYCVGLNHYVKDLDENKRLEIIKELLKSNEKDDVFINIGSHLITEYENEAMEICNNYSFDKYNDSTLNELSIIDIKCYNTTLYKYIIEHLQQNALKYNDCDILRILHIEKENQKTYSLRSLKENIKVDEMARFYGGNGHEKAAGYSINN
jgi:hypothetical protein